MPNPEATLCPTLPRMPVEFLSDAEAAVFGRFDGPPSRAELERDFFLDDADKAIIRKRHGEHNQLGFAVQLGTVRYLGTFLPDPIDVPAEVVQYQADQLGVDASSVGAYLDRRQTRFDHQKAIRKLYGLKDFARVEAEFIAWVDGRAWTTGDSARTIFGEGVAWLRQQKVLLPGVTTLARLVARVRDMANDRLWDTLAGLLSSRQRVILTGLLDVPDGARVSDLDRWRREPTHSSGRALEKALGQAQEILSTGFGAMPVQGVPYRRLADLARNGTKATATALRRYGTSRKLATLLATVRFLEAKTIDDCLELLDLVMSVELVGRAERATDKARAKRHPKLARASATLAVAVETLLEVTEYGEELTLEQVWEAIDALVPRKELKAAVATVTGMVPPPGADDDGEMRALLAERIASVSGFVKLLPVVIEFGAHAEAAPVLAAMKTLPKLLDGRKKKVTLADVDPALVTGSWKRLVFPGEDRVDKNAYVMCVDRLPPAPQTARPVCRGLLPVA
ncbi:DUF4158 domain-containing protein [Nonomuraea sp. NPDC055795]